MSTTSGDERTTSASPETKGGVLPISVVVPVYNRENLVREALASVVSQSRPPAEIIVVDDGSTDGSAAAAAALATRVIRQENLGSAAARNRGIEEATQPWIAFLDSDDLWDSTKLEEQWVSAPGLSPGGADPVRLQAVEARNR